MRRDLEKPRKALSWPARLLLAGYPPWWRCRYDAEMRDTILTMSAGGHWRAKHARDLFRGLLEAWLNPGLGKGDGAVPDTTRRLIPRTAWGLLLFVLAGGGFAKIIDGPPAVHATHDHLAVRLSLYGLMGAAFATAAVMAIGTIPYLLAILRQEVRQVRRGLAPLVVVLVCFAGYSGVLAITSAVAGSTPVHHPNHVGAFVALVAATVLCGVACTTALLRIATNTPETRTVRNARRLAMVAVGALTTAGTLAVLSWVIAVAVESPGLLHGANGLLATATMPSIAVSLMGLIGAVALCAPCGVEALSSRRAAPRSSS